MLTALLPVLLLSPLIYLQLQKSKKLEKLLEDEKNRQAPASKPPVVASPPSPVKPLVNLESQAEVVEARSRAKQIVDEAFREAGRTRREAQEQSQRLRTDLSESEKKLNGDLKALDGKINELLTREKDLEVTKVRLLEKEKEIERFRAEQTEQLTKIGSLTRDEARRQILENLEKDLTEEIARRIKEAEQKVKEEADAKAKEIIATAMLHGATQYVAEYTVSVVKLPDEEVKGRIIGKEGRNIRSFELATGVDVDLDEAKEIRLSCFDPVRREIARVSLERLLADGRIQPARIEEIVAQTRQDIEKIMHQEGEKLAQAVGVFNLPLEIIDFLGRFKYRFSYGQNMIAHTLEETKVGIKLAQELGVDVEVVRLGCLLHDIGKVVTEDEGTHIQLGVDLLRRFKLPERVINAVGEHHEDKPFSSVESVLVYVADAISAARPGARVEDIEAYVRRMSELEAMALAFKGVKSVFAISAGREVRVVVDPLESDDAACVKLAHDIAAKIEKELTYPGQVKVTVIRETRATGIAK